MRVVDVLMAFPLLILVVAIMSILGPGLVYLYIAYGVVGWIQYARISRGETLATRNLEYVVAARTIGSTTPLIMFRHILPNVISPGLVYVFTEMVLAILTVTTLSYLGLGPQPPTPEWGFSLASTLLFYGTPVGGFFSFEAVGFVRPVPISVGITKFVCFAPRGCARPP
jgi:peptide/nickel transport system permease protein